MTKVPDARGEREQAIRLLCRRGEYEAALEATLAEYGSEIYGFLIGIHRDETADADTFSHFGESVWKGLPGFNWACTLRTWIYVLARNASYRHRVRNKGRAREVPFDATSAPFRLEAAVRTATQSWLRTEHKDRFAALRASLSREDQELLILRVDRGLSWNELARILLGDSAASEERCQRESARLRKRFQLVRHQLRELGRRAGLIKDAAE